MLWVEQGEERTGLVATVAPVLPVDREYTFAVPDELGGRLRPGQRVLVPVGKKGRLVTAFCLAIEQGPWSHTLKPIDSLVDPVSYLDGRLLDLSLGVGFFDIILKLLFYFLHERAWNRVWYGRDVKVDRGLTIALGRLFNIENT